MRLRHIALVVLLLLPGTAFALGNDSMRGTFVVSGELAYFAAAPRADALELWVTDGTPGGTRSVADLGGGSVTGMVAWKDGVAFFVSSQSHLTLWRADRTEAVRLADFGNALAGSAGVVGERLLFSIERPDAQPPRHDLWRSDGTSEGTAAVAGLPRAVARAVAAGNLLYLALVPPPEGWQGTLWRSDGTGAGTFSLDRPTHGILARVGTSILFDSSDEIWRNTDGTLQGAELVADVAATEMIVAANVVYAATYFAVWRVDGTVSGTRQVLVGDGWPRWLIPSGDDLYFAGRSQYFFYDAVTGRATSVGFATPMAAVADGRFFFGSFHSGGGFFATDGPGRPAARLAGSLDPAGAVVPFGRSVLFSTSDGVHGFEPWISDGTPEGTAMLANARPETVLRGTVLEAGTGRPLPGARVTLEGRACATCTGHFEAEAKEDGSFVFEALPDDHYSVSVTAAGYVNQGWPTGIDATGAGVHGIDFVLQRGGGISGRVVDERGAPVADLVLDISTDSRLLPHSLDRFVVSTRADGTYSTPPTLQPGLPWSVRTTDANLASTNFQRGYSGMLYGGFPCWTSCDPRRDGTPVVPEAGQTRAGIDFVVKPLGILRGRLIDAVTGEPLLTGSIYARGNAGRSDNLSQATRSGAGEYAVQIADGGATLTAYFDGFTYLTSYRDAIFVAPGTTSFYDIPLTPGAARIRGRVTDAQTGRPVAGFQVRVTSTNTDSNGGGEVLVTNGDGRYSTRPTMRSTRYLVSAPALGPWAAAATVAITLRGTEVGEVDLQLHRVAVLTGIVRDAATRQPLAGARIQLVAGDGLVVESSSSDAGAYSVPVSAGTYLARAVKGGWYVDTARVTVTGAVDEVTVADFAPAPACAPSIRSPQTVFSAQGGTGRITLSATCTACTFSSSSFLHLPPLCGTGGAVTFTVDPNPGAERTGWIVVPGGAVEIRQEGRRVRSVGR
jgi:ELWxxDGT repeat protein